MAGGLTEPGKPAGHVVSVDPETGVATCNDGRQLQPAAKNPWYVLMTIAGEPEDMREVGALATNRRLWNGWACSKMTEAERAALAGRIKLDPADLAPLTAEERARIAAAFRARLAVPKAEDKSNLAKVTRAFQALDRDGQAAPDPDEGIGLDSIHFSRDVELEKWVFRGFVSFSDATFDGVALFNSATFGGLAMFVSATFGGDAFFGSATFDGDARFGSATFGGVAEFTEATFGGPAWFSAATFGGPAWFASATFVGDADFSDGAFAGPADFRNARFRGGVPEFYQRRFHQNTIFTDRRDIWPDITAETAEQAERAYTRLRQAMKELDKPDDEAFFGRQELRCKALTEGRFHRLVSRGYGFFSDYGFSIGRPLAGLGTVVFAGAGPIGSWLKFCRGEPGSGGIFQGLGISLANTFSFLGFHRLYIDKDTLAAMPDWLKAIGGVQTVAGVTLLFLLGLGLRNRFRLK